MHLPLLKANGLLEGRAYTSGVDVEGIETLAFGDVGAALSRFGAHEFETSVNWDVSAFAKMLAKIAYAAAVASGQNLPRERVPVLPLILGKRDDASYWIGSAEFKLRVEDERPQHALGFALCKDPRNKDHCLLVVRIKLFASSGATGYEVVVLEGA
jgi:hypothetical protein